MAKQGAATSVADPLVVLTNFAELLADSDGLPAALDALAAGLGLRTVLLKDRSGELLAVGGEALLSVPPMRTTPVLGLSLDLPVPGAAGWQAGTLTVVGARPSTTQALRSAAAVLGLALARAGRRPGADDFDDLEAEREELADSLHDGPVQTLVVARYAADAAVRGGDVAEAREAVQQALVEVRHALWRLRPRGGHGLAAALEQLSLHLGGASLEIRAEGDISGAPAVLAFRLVQAVAGPTPIRVTVQAACVEVEGGTLPSPERWVRRAHTLGAHLAVVPGRLQLDLPTGTTRRTTDARTAP